MNPDTFAEWFRRQGERVVRTQTSFWVEAGPRILQAFPYHWIISPSQDELNDLLQGYSAIGLRYSTAWDQREGAASYHVVFTGREYPLSLLPKKTRPDIRHMAQRARVEQISFDRMADEGWLLRQDTLQRQGREGAETREWWGTMCQSAIGLPGFEAWAVIVDGHLAATLICFIYEDCCNALYQQSRTEYLPLGVNNALTFVFTNEILKRPGDRWIFYGLHSLDAPPGVDQFKFYMGYTAKPVRQRVVFNPWLQPLINLGTHSLLRAGHKVLPGNSLLAKAEGLFRFHLQGRIPLIEQTKPEALKDMVLT